MSFATRENIYSNMATLMHSGLPMSRALVASGEAIRGPLPEAMRRLGDSVMAGEVLADAMDDDPRSFPQFDRTLVRVAENSGRLPETFQILADWYQFRGKVRRQLQSAMLLPIIVLHAACLMFPLPGLVTGSTTPVGYLFTAFGLLVPWYAVFFIIVVAGSTPVAAPIIDRIVLAVPFLGRAIMRLELSRFCRAFNSLFSAGGSLTEGVRLAKSVCHNGRVAAMLEGGVASAERGEPVSDGFAGELPPEFRASWRTAEETGSLEPVSEHLADKFAEESQYLLEELSRWLPRFFYVLVALLMIGMIAKLASDIFAGLSG